MRNDAVLSLLRSLEEVANRRCLRVVGSSDAITRDYDEGRVACALEMRDAIRKAEEVVEKSAGNYADKMSAFEFAAMLRTMRELQDLSRKVPQSQERRANAARYELRCDQLLRKILAADENRENVITL